MGSINKALILGNLGKDAEIRYTQNGSAVASFSVATTETWTDKNTGERKEQTEWHRCVLWGKQAETLQPYLKKGKQVHIEGRIQTRQWEKDGVKRYTTEIRVDRVTLLGGGGRRDADEGYDSGVSDEHSGGAQPDPVPAAVTDEDIPF